MPELMKCGHSIGYAINIRDTDGVKRRWCFACLFEKFDLKDCNGLMPVNHNKLALEKENEKLTKQIKKAKKTIKE